MLTINKSNPFVLGVDNDSSAALDLLRAMAAQLVCVGHALNLFIAPGTSFYPNVGVLLFFLLSGFLIAYTLEKKFSGQSYLFSHFAIERVARIYTAYVPALILIAATDFVIAKLDPAAPMSDRSLHAWLMNLAMLQNYVGWHILSGATTYGTAGQLTSLALEFHIYVFVGALFFILRHRPSFTLFIVAIAFCWQPLAYFGSPAEGSDRSLFILWLAGFISYYLCSRANRSQVLVRWSGAFFLLAISHWLYSRTPGAEYLTSSYPSLIAAFICLVIFTQGCRILANRARLVGVIRWFADCAFTLFLVHYSVERLVSAVWPRAGLAGAILSIILSNALAFLLAMCFEARYRIVAGRIKDYFRLSQIH